jgi:hypothetical protein
VDNALGLGTVDDLPELPDHGSMRESFPQQGFEVPASPDAFHGKRFKEKGSGEIHGKLGRTGAQSENSTLSIQKVPTVAKTTGNPA